jgi:hypothetical protein
MDVPDVGQGYRNQYTVPVDPTAPSSSRTFFRSASDTLHDVYANASLIRTPGNSTPAHKRGRSLSPEQGPESERDLDMHTEGSNPPQVEKHTSANSPDAAGDARPTKPLRQRRPLGKSQSLPAHSNPFGSQSTAPSSVVSPIPEDDWSEDAFSSPGKAKPFSPTYL